MHRQFGLIFSLRIFLGEFCEPEIENLGLSVVCNNNILSFDIAVHNALRVGRRQSIADLDRDFERARQVQGTTPNQFADVATGDKLHHDKMQTIEFGQVMNGADVGMIQGRS